MTFCKNRLFVIVCLVLFVVGMVDSIVKVLGTKSTAFSLGVLTADKVEFYSDKKGNIIYDKETRDTEIVKYTEDIETYMAREVLPYVPDAKWFWEENLGAKKPVIKIGAEIPFTRYFYKYTEPEKSEVLEEKFLTLEKSVSERIKNLFGGRMRNGGN